MCVCVWVGARARAVQPTKILVTITKGSLFSASVSTIGFTQKASLSKAYSFFTPSMPVGTVIKLNIKPKVYYHQDRCLRLL